MIDTTSMKKADYVYLHRGFWDTQPEARVRVRFIERSEGPPILLLTEPHENESTSLTNLIEVLAAELIAKHCPARFETLGEPPAIVIEHYPPDPNRPAGPRNAGQYDLVTFASWTPRPARSGSQHRTSLGEPSWRHLSAAEVRALIGDEADDLPPA
jgi:hypothetical protein